MVECILKERSVSAMSANPLRYFASDTYTLNVMYYLKCNMCIKTITWLGKTVGNVRFNRSSPPEVFCKKGVLRNFTKFTGKHLCQSPFFNKNGLFFNFFVWMSVYFPSFFLLALQKNGWSWFYRLSSCCIFTEDSSTYS